MKTIFLLFFLFFSIIALVHPRHVPKPPPYDLLIIGQNKHPSQAQVIRIDTPIPYIIVSAKRKGRSIEWDPKQDEMFKRWKRMRHRLTWMLDEMTHDDDDGKDNKRITSKEMDGSLPSSRLGILMDSSTRDVFKGVFQVQKSMGNRDRDMCVSPLKHMIYHQDYHATTPATTLSQERDSDTELRRTRLDSDEEIKRTKFEIKLMSHPHHRQKRFLFSYNNWSGFQAPSLVVKMLSFFEPK